MRPRWLRPLRRALQVFYDELAAHHDAKGDAWRTQSVRAHLIRCRDHCTAALEKPPGEATGDIWHAQSRAIMAVAVLENAREL